MPNQWFIESGSHAQGPFTDQQLRNLADGGQVTHRTRIRLGSDGQWTTATSVKGLFPTPPPPAPSSDDAGFDSLVSEVIHNNDGDQVPTSNHPKPDSAKTTFKPRDLPMKGFDELRTERGILRGLSFFVTFVLAPIAIVGSIGLFVGAGVLSSRKETEAAALQLVVLAVSTLSSGFLALVGAVATRLVCGTVDLGLYIAALLEDIRQHTRDQ